MSKRHALSAVLWSGLDLFLRQGLQFIVALVLARLLSPEEFGTIALLLVFTSIAGAFVEGGFTNALIQRQDTTHTDEDTVFWFNLGMAATTGLGLWAVSPFIADFYRTPILVPLMAVMALNLFVGALGSIQNVLMTKRLDFRGLMKVGVVAFVVSGAVAVWMAWAGFGVWALAVQTLLATTLTTIGLWVVNPWRPTATFSMASARRLFGFGGYLMASSLLEIAYSRVANLLIGKMYSVQALGYYSRADSTKQLPVGIIVGLVARVTLPLYSAAAHDKDKLRRGVQLSVQGLMLVSVPVMLGLAALAEPLFQTMFGPKWMPAVEVFRVLCLVGMLWPLQIINLNVMMAQGHSQLCFRLEVFKKAIGLVLILVGSFYGMMGIAWGQVIGSALGFGVSAYFTGKYLGYGFIAQTRDVGPVTLISVAIAAAVYGVSQRWHANGFVELSTLVGLGAVSFVVAAVLFRVTAARNALVLTRSYFH